jgi:hypothetical protein
LEAIRLHSKDPNAKLKLKRFYSLLNIFDTFQDISTDDDDVNAIIEYLEKISSGDDLTYEEMTDLVTKDSRYSFLDSREKFTQITSETYGPKAMVISDIGGMNVGNRLDMGYIAGRFIRVLLDAENYKNKAFGGELKPEKENEFNLIIDDILKQVDESLTDSYWFIYNNVKTRLEEYGYTLNTASAGGDELRFDITLINDENFDIKAQLKEIQQIIKSVYTDLRDTLSVHGMPITARVGICGYNGLGINSVKMAFERSDASLAKAKDNQMDNGDLFPNVTQDYNYVITDISDFKFIGNPTIQLPINNNVYQETLLSFPGALDQEFYTATVFDMLMERQYSADNPNSTAQKELLLSIATNSTSIPLLNRNFIEGNSIYVADLSGNQKKYWNDITKNFVFVNQALYKINRFLRDTMGSISSNFGLTTKTLVNGMPKIIGRTYNL